MTLRNLLAFSLGIIVFGFGCVALAADEPAAEPSKKPQWQRMLQGEDAKAAEGLQKQIDELSSKDDYAGAILAAEELLALRMKRQGDDHHESVDVKQQIAALRKIGALDAEKRMGWRSARLTQLESIRLVGQGQFAAALPIQRKLLDGRREVLGEDHADTAAAYNNVAYILNAYGKSAEAQPLNEKALEIRRRVLGEDHPDTANSYSNLASNLAALGKLRDAQPLFRAGLEIHLRVLGEHHADTADSYNNLAYTLNALGKPAGAEPLYRKALEIRRLLLGEDHPDTATSYNNMARNLDSLGRPAEAEPLHKKALEALRHALGEDHPHTATSYNNVAHNLAAQGKLVEAQPVYRQALETLRRVLGEDHPDTATVYNNAAVNLDAQGKSVEAQPLHHKALEIRRRVLGEEHPDTANSYDSLASNMQAQGRLAEAEGLFREALETYRRTLGDDHPDTAQSYNNLASNLDARGQPAEAQRLHQKSLEIRSRILGDDHPDMAQTYNNLAFNLDAQEKFAEAEPHLQKALELCRRTFGEDHPHTAQTYNNLAFNLDARGNFARGEPQFRTALRIRRRVLGESHPDTATSYANLAINLYSQNESAEAEQFLRRAVFAFEASRLAGAVGLDRASLGPFSSRLMLAAMQQSREPLQAWNQVELSLARGLLDQQVVGKQTLAPNGEAEWVRERSRALDKLAQILALVTNPTRSEEETSRLDKLLDERREAEERLAALAVVASTREVAGGDTIRAALPVDSALLCWVDVASGSGGVDEHWACLVRRDGDPRWERLPGTGLDGKWSRDDAALPTKLRDALAGSGSRAEIESLAGQLQAQRLAPILKHLSGVKTLYVVPAGEMAGIPIEVLTADYTISYVPSGTYLARLKDRPQPAGTALLALGDPVFSNSRVEEPSSPQELPPGGLLVTQVVPEGAAATAGLKKGDVVIRYGKVDVASVPVLTEAIKSHAREKEISVTVWREGKAETFTVNVPPGKLGVGLAREPAREAIASRRQGDALLVALRGGNWKELPGTRVELSQIASLFTDATRLLDSAASEQSLEDLRKQGALSRFRYLHLATHGEGNQVKAFESALILSQDALPPDPLPRAGEPFLNGQLSAREVLDFWKLDAELVTLSACETAVGKKGGGDGLLGFAQAFLSAGSRSVCLSLWNVDDTATALLMARFYQNLLGKRDGLDQPMGKAAALAEAKRWLRELPASEAATLAAAITKDVSRGDRGKGERLKLVVPPTSPEPRTDESKPFSDPRYWAAFILIGDPN